MTKAQLVAAFRFVEMALEPKRLQKAEATYKATHHGDLMTAFHEAKRLVERATAGEA